MNRTLSKFVNLAFVAMLMACSSGGSSGGGSPSGGNSGGGQGNATAGVAPSVAFAGPSQNSTIAQGDVIVTFATSNFTVGAEAQPHARFFLDGDSIPYEFFNGPTKEVRHASSTGLTVEWQGSNQFRILNVPSGFHILQLSLTDAAGNELDNPESKTAIFLAVGVPPTSVPTIIPASPLDGSVFPPGAVHVTFIALNHQIGSQAGPHMHLYIDDDPTPLEFTNGPTVNEDNGVLYFGAHTHRVHWKSPTSFRIYQLASGVHHVRMDLVDGAHNVMPNPEASQTLTFTIVESTTSEFRLEPVLSGLLSFPSKMALSPDGRVFITEVYTGDLRVVDIVNGIWQLRPTPLYHVDGPSLGPAIGDQGLTGIVLDPNFSKNGYIYIYYTVLDGSANRVLRLKEVSGQVVEETVLIDNLPSAVTHNGGDLHFGPDGKLWLTTGEAEQSLLAQDSKTLFGKMLRYNSDGSIPNDNPAPGSPVYAWGLRNTFDFLFHPLTGDLWATENGPDVNDEINLIVRGGNYGWPVVTGVAGNPTYVDPLVVFPSTIGPTGIVTVSVNSAYPSTYHNQLLFADVNAGRIHRIELESTNPTHVQSVTIAFDGGRGGLLDFIEGPDGYLYVSSLDSVYRVVLNNGP